MSHRIVIVGGGAGGLELATRLGKTLGKRGTASVMLVDANLTHIWKPLLHEVAAGSLNSSEDELNYVAQAKWNHFEFQLGRMSGLDRTQKKIQLAATYDEAGLELVPAREVPYDTLVIAVGSTTNDFGTQGAAQHCLFLDTRKQAERFHQQLLNHYLRAHAGDLASEKISVAIVGAGATGVELAAELHHAAHELAAYGLDKIKPENMHITLIEAGPRVLPALPERIGGPVHKTLEKLGVNVMTNAAVGQVTADSLITVDGKVTLRGPVAAEIAAQRHPGNASALRSMAAAWYERQNDSAVALDVLRNMHAQSTDKEFRRLLQARIARLEGLLALRVALAEYRQQHQGKLPTTWAQLIGYGGLKVFPEDPLGAGYNIMQAKIALGSGGWSGKGFMQGTQSRLNFLPEKHTDFIFTTLAEEFGFVGAFSLLGLYALIIGFCLVAAFQNRDRFSALLIVGVAANFFFYIAVNLSMVMGMAPVVGVPLPLLSYGGSAMLVLLVGFGLVQSAHVHRPR